MGHFLESIFRRSYAKLYAASLIGLCPLLSALEYELDAPNLQQNEYIRYATDGIRMRINDPDFPFGQIEIIADGMRWDEENGNVFFTGNVVVLHPHYQLRATHLGYNLTEQRGEAREVTLHAHKDGQRIELSCERISVDPKKFQLFRMHSSGGHGSLFALNAADITIRRADEPHKHRSGFTAEIDDIIIKHPRFKIGSVPVFWLPIAYRDYRLDYPWTKFEIGHEKDRGAFIRARIGVDLPRMGDLSSTLRFRSDHYELSGKGLGVESFWTSKTLGKGSFYWFQMDPEKLYTDIDGGFPDFEDLALNNLYDKMGGTVIARRKAKSWEFEHKTSFSGGAAYLRYAHLPNAIDGSFDKDQFRADHHELVMEEQPIARQGLGASWSMKYLTIDYQRDQQPFEDSRLHDRNHALHIGLTPISITEHIHSSAGIHLEQFEKNDAGKTGTPLSETWRFRGQLDLRASQWLPQWGYDAIIGLKTLSYYDVLIEDIAIDDNNTQMPFGEFGLKTRLLADFENGLQHSFVPRIALAINGKAEGDDLLTYNTGDGFDDLQEDRQFVLISLDNAIRWRGRNMNMLNELTYGIRETDRRYNDENGIEQIGPDSFVRSENSIDGSPHPDWSINAEFDYDGRIRDWVKIDASVNWKINEHLSFGLQNSLIPETNNEPEYWQLEPSIKIKANRYLIDYSVTMRDDGEPIDSYQIGFTRTMVDGSLSMTLEVDRDEDGELVDRRIDFSIAVGSWGGL